MLFRFKKCSPAPGVKTGGSGVPTSIWENYGRVDWTFKLWAFFNTVVILPQTSGSAKIKTSPATPAYYSCEHAHSRHISSTSHSSTRPSPKLWCRKDPGHIYQLLEKLSSWLPGVTSYDQFCPLLFRFKKWSPGSESKTGSSAISISIWENYGEVSWIVKLFEFFNTVVILPLSGIRLKTQAGRGAKHSPIC